MSSAISIRTAIEYAAVLGILIAYFGGYQITSSGNSDTGLNDFNAAVHTSQDKLESLVYPGQDLQCSDHGLDVHVFSTAPLIIHISNFVTDEEAEHLIRMSENHWNPSTIFNSGQEVSDETVRKSEKARIDRDSVVQCLESRALSFQGWPKDTFIERLWTQRYKTGGHYAHHYDWASANPYARRASTFMVYLAANCTGGGTHFPLLRMPEDKRWCEYLDCSADALEGVTFLPRPGAAVFWENFNAEGQGWKEGLHAGLPVESGVKIGLNVWSWYQRGLTPEELPSS